MDGTPVKLHVYDIANTDNENLNSFLKFVNNVSREVRAGGIYHGASRAFVGLHGIHDPQDCLYWGSAVLAHGTLLIKHVK